MTNARHPASENLPSISLVNADPRVLTLPQLSSDRIHYPPEAAEILAEMELFHFWHRARRDIVVKRLKREFSGAVTGPPVGLDIGCGTGWIATELTALGFPTLGIDGFANFSKRSVAAGTRLFRGDILGFEPRAEFDYVLLLDVIEHVENDAGFLAQAMKFLKPGGIALIHVPALPFLWSLADDYAGHLRRYDQTSLRKTVAEAVSRLGPLTNGARGARLETLAYRYATFLPILALSRWIGSFRKNAPANGEFTYRSPAWLNALAGFFLAVEHGWTDRSPAGTSLFAVVRMESKGR